MPFPLTDINLPLVNVKIDKEALSTPDKAVDMLKNMQNEINRCNRSFQDLLSRALGSAAYLDQGPTDAEGTPLGSGAYAAVPTIWLPKVCTAMDNTGGRTFSGVFTF